MHHRYLAVFVALFALAAARADGIHTKGTDPIHIAHGEKVKLADYVVPGKTTVFDFYSEYCPPCRALSPRLEKLHHERKDIVVVKIDINRPDVRGIDWHSPVAREFDLNSIPHLTVYGPDGALQADGDEAEKLVEDWIGG